MADDKVRYVLDVDDKGTPKLVKFGTASAKAGKQAESAFAGAGKGLEELGGSIPGVGSAMSALSGGPFVAGAAGAAALAAGLGAIVFNSIDMADSMNDLSLRLGISTERLSVLSLYAEQSGTNIDDLASAMGKLGVKIANGDKTLAGYGVTSSSVDEALFQLADKIAATESPMLRLKIATDAFGKSGQQMLPLLVQGGEALRTMAETAPIVSTEMAGMADEFNDKMAEMKGQFVSIGLKIAETVLPQLLKWAEGVDRIRQAVGMLTQEEQKAEERQAVFDKFDKLIEARKKGEKLIGPVRGAYTIDGKTLSQTLSDVDAKYIKPVPIPVAPYVPPGQPVEIATTVDFQDTNSTAYRDQVERDNAKIDKAFAKQRFQENWLEHRKEDALEMSEKERVSVMIYETDLNNFYAAEAEKQAAIDESNQRMISQQNALASSFEGAFSTAFSNTINNGQNLFSALSKSFGDMLTQMAIQMAARAAVFGLMQMVTGGTFGAIGAAGSSGTLAGGGGGLLNFIFRASGGPTEAGMPTVVGERRPEAIIPRGPGRVSASGGGGDTYILQVGTPSEARSTIRGLRQDNRRRRTGIA